jgi:hypothetical protein
MKVCVGSKPGLNAEVNNRLILLGIEPLRHPARSVVTNSTMLTRYIQ